MWTITIDKVQIGVYNKFVDKMGYWGEGENMQNVLKVDIEKIILERANQGLSAHELSLRAGLSKNCVSNIERGHTTPRLHTVGKIVKALGKKIEDFIIEEEAV